MRDIRRSKRDGACSGGEAGPGSPSLTGTGLCSQEFSFSLFGPDASYRPKPQFPCRSVRLTATRICLRKGTCSGLIDQGISLHVYEWASRLAIRQEMATMAS